MTLIVGRTKNRERSQVPASAKRRRSGSHPLVWIGCVTVLGVSLVQGLSSPSGERLDQPAVSRQERLGRFEARVVDESASIPELRLVRDEALAAVKTRDAERLSRLAVEGSNLEHAIQRIEPVYDAGFWAQTRKALSWGGAFTPDPSDLAKRRWCAPAAYGVLLAGQIERLPTEFLSYELIPVVIFGPAKLHLDPVPDSPVVDLLSFELARTFSDTEEMLPWVQVGVPGRLKGWIERNAMWSVDDQYVCFAQVKQDWKIIDMKAIAFRQP